jgi:hypothetical protein
MIIPMNRTFSVSQLGRMGRFGNAVFQYMFAKTYARRFGMQFECPSWVGNYLFAANDLPLAHRFPIFREKDSHGRDDALIPAQAKPLVHRDIQGYFQYHTHYYAPDQAFLRDVFQPAPHLRRRLDLGWERIARRGKTAVGIHVRRGDYGYGIFYLTPVEWYQRWLEEVWPTLDDPFLYVASDDPAVTAAFARYQPVTAQDFRVNIGHPKLNFFRDWYALTRCQQIAMPNSTFSFSAAMFAEPGVQCYRSSLPDRDFVPIDAWDAPPLVMGAEAEADNFPEIPGLIRPGHNIRRKPPWRSMLRRLLVNHPLVRLTQRVRPAALARSA